MGHLKQVDSPHPREDGQSEATKAPRRDSASGCSHFACSIFSVGLLGIALIAVFVLFNATGLLTLIVGPRLTTGLTGVVITVAGVVGLVSIAHNPRWPGRSLVWTFLAVMVPALMGLVGVAMLVDALASGAGKAGF